MALVQARLAVAALAAARPGGPETEIVVIKTTGDQVQDRPLADIGGKGLFAKEIEAALLAGAIDLAVHSLKDMETHLPPGLTVAAVLPRADPRDALIAPGAKTIADLPKGARIATGSIRRAAQLLALRPDLAIASLRGNVETRLAKLRAGAADATILAVAGLQRLGLMVPEATPLDPDVMLPAACQGLVALECRESDGAMRALLTRIGDEAGMMAQAAERALLAGLDGSCHTPIGALAEIRHGQNPPSGVARERGRPPRSAHRAQRCRIRCRRLGPRRRRRIACPGAGWNDRRGGLTMRILVTRPEPEAHQFAEALAAIGIEPIVAPLLTIVPIEAAPPELARFQAVLLTSANGARALAERGAERDIAVLTVGNATAAAARAAGYRRIASADGDWRDLAALVRSSLDPAKGPLLHATGADHGNELIDDLTPHGFAIERAVLYRAIAADRLPDAALAALRGAPSNNGAPSFDGVALFSPRTARTFIALVDAAGLGGALACLNAYCLSPAIAEPLEAAKSRLPWRAIHSAPRPNSNSLLDTIRASMTAPAQPAGSRPMTDEVPRNETANPSAASSAPNDAERIIGAFGGIRPMAKTMGLPVTTVQGWKERGAIPLARMAELREAAAKAGIDLGNLPLAAMPDGEAAPRPETVTAEKVAEPPRAGVKAAETAPPPPPLIEATVDSRPSAAPGRPIIAFAGGCAAAFLLGMAALWAFGTGGGTSDADRKALEAMQGRVVTLTRQLEDLVRRQQTDAAAVQSRMQRIEAAERSIGEHRDRLSNVAATTAAIAARLEKLDADMKSLTSQAPAGGEEIRQLRDLVRQLGQRVNELPKELPDIAAMQRLAEQARQWGERLNAIEARLTPLAEARPPADAGQIKSALDKQAADAAAALERVAAEARAVSERLGRDLRALRDDLTALDGRVRGAAAEPARRGAGDAGALVVAIGQLRRAVGDGGAYRPAFNAVAALAQGRTEFAAPLQALAARADRGIPGPAVLRRDFDKLSVAILRASAQGEIAEDSDWADRVWARLKTLVTVRKTGETAGTTPRALVSRAEAALARGDAAAAAAAIEALPPAARKPAEAWLDDAKAWLAADAALGALDRLAVALLQGAPAR